MTSHAAVMSHLAAASPASSNDITPGVLGFLVIAAMAVVVFFLLRSMNKRLRRVRAVRDAGLAPGSELGSTAAGPSAPGGAPAGAGAHPGAAASASRAANAAAAGGTAAASGNSDSADTSPTADTADAAGPADGAAGG